MHLQEGILGMASPTFQHYLQFTHRNGKHWKIEQFFEANLGQRFPSDRLHGEWGSSFRARVSEINLDRQSRIVIKNQNFFDEQAGGERSFYWSELRGQQLR